MALDIIAAVLSKGWPTNEINKFDKESYGGCNLILIAIDPTVFASEEEVKSIVAGMEV